MTREMGHNVTLSKLLQNILLTLKGCSDNCERWSMTPCLLWNHIGRPQWGTGMTLFFSTSASCRWGSLFCSVKSQAGNTISGKYSNNTQEGIPYWEFYWTMMQKGAWIKWFLKSMSPQSHLVVTDCKWLKKKAQGADILRNWELAKVCANYIT